MTENEALRALLREARQTLHVQNPGLCHRIDDALEAPRSITKPWVRGYEIGHQHGFKDGLAAMRQVSIEVAHQLAFDKYLDDRMKDEPFAEAYFEAVREIKRGER